MKCRKREQIKEREERGQNNRNREQEHILEGWDLLPPQWSIIKGTHLQRSTGLTSVHLYFTLTG
jgi:hypothetical protein